MVNHFARPRRNRGAWLETLLKNQAETAEGAELADLHDFIDTLKEVKHALVAVDNPAPARGYAAILPTYTSPEGLDVPTYAVARVHVIPNQADDVYRALFSQIIVQARNMRAGLALPFQVEIQVDSATAAPHVVDAVERLGEPYAVKMGRSVGEKLSSAQPAVADTADKPEDAEPVEDAPAEEVAEVVVEAPAEAPAEVEAEAVVEAVGAAEEVAEDEDEDEAEDGFECFDCGRKFKSPQALGSHSRSHNS